MIKKWMMLLFAVLLLAGCGQNADTESLSDLDKPGTVTEQETRDKPDKPVQVNKDQTEEDSQDEKDLNQSNNTNQGDVSENGSEVSGEDSDKATKVEASGEVLEDSVTYENETLVDKGEGSGAESAESKLTGQPNPAERQPVLEVEEVKAIWLSYLDLMPIFNQGMGTEEDYRAYMGQVLAHMESLELNTLIYQVRPFSDALYPSQMFPPSYIITGTEGEDLAFDPFGIALAMAHEKGIRIEAWINPYRVRTAQSQVPLSDQNTALKWYEDGSRRVLKSPEGNLVYNPSSEEVRQMVVEGVMEILETYPVDGIHFDDYFYPTTAASFDEVDYLSFLHSNDALSQEEWRRHMVNLLIAQVHEAIKAYDEAVVFGVSPEGDIEANLQRHYADVTLWMSETGYVDYLMPQIYYGFNHGRLPFSQVLSQWHYLNEIGIDLIPGIAVYKVGKEDLWAGDLGKNEWIEEEGILARMVTETKGQPSYDGYALYRYGSMFLPEEELMERFSAERDGLKALGH